MTNDEPSFSNDGKYRNFVNQIDRSLKGFEYSSEWADLITNLGKLTKILQANSKYSIIPNKHLLGKRLSQCLHPALPGGVHLKALECYDVLFRNIGPKILAEEIFVYCTGLFPLMSPSSMSVKKPLFDLYETHFIPLRTSIKPAFVGLLQGLLPGLEEGSEFYERANNILEQFIDCVDKVYFYTCLWKVMLQAPSIRIFGTTFLINHFNKRMLPEDQVFLFGNNINLMLNSITQLLCDQNVLVQRQTLDFVILSLHIHTSQLTLDDRKELCAACLSVLLRRDMSLNRRFYSWLLGSSIDRQTVIRYCLNDKDKGNKSYSISDSDLYSKYFNKYSKDILIAAIKIVIKKSTIHRSEKSSIKPFRMILTLMDRNEIGSAIIEDILFDLIVFMNKEYLYLVKNTGRNNTFKTKEEYEVEMKKPSAHEEFLKTANIFFSNLEGTFFWGYFEKILETTFKNESLQFHSQHEERNINNLCDLIDFVLIRLPIDTYVDIFNDHLPSLLYKFTELLNKHVADLSIENIKNILKTYKFIFDQIILKSSMSIVSGENESKSPKSKKPNDFIQKTIVKFREFFQNFSILKLGYSQNQIDKCVKIVFKDNRNVHLSNRCMDSNMLDVNSNFDDSTVNVYSDICHLLIEMTSFPIFEQNDLDSISDCEDESGSPEIPQWFICLIISGCFVKDFNIKSEALHTTLDFLHATRSIVGSKSQKSFSKRKKSINVAGLLSDNTNNNFDENRVNAPVVSINFPVLTKETLEKLDHSLFYELAGLSLWDYLSPNYPQYHQSCVNLFNYLHQNSPSSNLCEEMILQKMLSDSVEESLDAYQRFILMWQLLAKAKSGSDPNYNKNIGNERNFDKCMLVLLDCLDGNNDVNGNDVLKTMCLSWLETSFHKGYFEYILIPLLLGSLRPDTARISLDKLISLSKAKQTPQDNEDIIEDDIMKRDEKRIYAISNENGHVKYHLKGKAINQNEIAPTTQDSTDSRKSGDETNPLVINLMDEVMTSVVSDKLLDECSDRNSTTDEENNVDEKEDDITVKESMEETATEAESQVDGVISDLNQSTSIDDCIQPLHGHLMIYCSVYDSNCVIYSLSRIKSLIKSLSGVFIPVLEKLIPSDLPKDKSKMKKILQLLTRHSNALNGNNFYQNITSEEENQFLQYNYLEMIMLICNWFMCSYYPIANSSVKLTENEFYDNKKVQLLAAEIIDLIIQEMLSISQIGYINYRGDFVSKSKTNEEIKEQFRNSINLCNIPKITLHCMATSVTRHNLETTILSDSILAQNENILDKKIHDSTQVALLRLILNVLKLDYGLNSLFVLNRSVKLKDTSTLSSKNNSQVLTEAHLTSPEVLKSLFSVSYNSSKIYVAVSRQSILLTSIVACLGAKRLRHLHSYYYQFIISSLGVWGQSTSSVLMPIVKRLCKNINFTAEIYESQANSNKLNDIDLNNDIIIDYAISTLECLKAICHFLLLDEALKCYQIQEEKGTASEHSLLGSLFSRNKEANKEKSLSPSTHIIEARESLLSIFPKVLNSILTLWESVALSENYRQGAGKQLLSSWIMGSPEKIYPLILSIVKPLMYQHSEHILISLARIWPNLDQFKLNSIGSFTNQNFINEITTSNFDLTNDMENREIYRVYCMLKFARGWKKSFTISDLLEKCKIIIKDNPGDRNSQVKKIMSKQSGIIRYNLLEFLQCFLSTQTGEKLYPDSSALFSLLRDICTESLSQKSFICLKIISDYLFKVAIADDRKDQREIQDLCQKIFENVAAIAGSSLEQPTWFRRAVQVKIDENKIPQSLSANNLIQNSPKEQAENMGLMNVTNELHCEPNDTQNNNGIDFKITSLNIRSTSSSKIRTVQSLNLLSLHLASIIDVIYKSEEKEKVQPILSTTIFPNVLPYLRFRSFGNVLNLRASSQLLASLSSYQHTRRSWRKDIFDILFENYFFQIDLESLKFWKIIIDNLMTQDKSTFKEAFTKLSITQGGGLNLFSSKEAEYDLNANCIKKLAFIIYCSETDQYVKSMPEIQERLSETVRLGIIPQIYSQLFLCFRVFILRISHNQLVSIWHMFLPALISTMQGLINDLNVNSKTSKNQDIFKRLPMYLSVCKVLDMIFLMSEEHVPQFLFYKWVFAGNLEDSNEIKYHNNSIPTFKPLITCVVDSYKKYFEENEISMKEIIINENDIYSEKLILNVESIQDIKDLTNFFFTVHLRNETNPESIANQLGITIKEKETNIFFNSPGMSTPNLERDIETIIDNEFLESLNKT